MKNKEDFREKAKTSLGNFEIDLYKNAYHDLDYQHTIKFHFRYNFAEINAALETFGHAVTNELEPLVNENNLPFNLPRVERYDAVGEHIDNIVHHPAYAKAGNIIYQTGLLKKLSASGLSECLSFFFLSSQAGEAGHNCPIACSAGMIRVLQKIPDFPEKKYYLARLTDPSFQTNFTGAQFLTEIQGGSDVALNTTYACQENQNSWRIQGEKWFCSNAGADLFFVTARFNPAIPGTKGLGLFLIPAKWDNKNNHYIIRRLKNKIGTRSMATAEIDFNGAYAIQIGKNEEGFHFAMNDVLHLSRLFNSVCVLGMARRAYYIAHSYAHHRIVFSKPIIHYPMVVENLARIKVENTAMIAAIFATAKLQDDYDNSTLEEDASLLLRLLVNIQKYFSAFLSFEHIHRCMDVLAGNGMIETFSPLPRLLRDCIVCENWEGTHNVLRMQVFKDMFKYDVDKIYLTFMYNEIKKISHCPQAQHLVTQLNLFKNALNDFRQQDESLQTLTIQFIVDKMAQLYCALKLLMEALHQKEVELSTSKLDCYDYFCMIYFDKSSIKYDKHYLQLINHIIAF